ncbi:aquaporin Z [Mucilaginibacter yixingensis]|uniref:Aquaporin Z n=1 Tax=Mucilaginibacter yixingensis TaxID=1295612 RepID=A0A2T5J559_9SPHI|nr:aquaporin [Mucilaginibacter yixingensis]PTQ92961.1 aquaporin Z [Mucilaginibacter yixingensis]
MRRYVAELLGTFIMVFCGTGAMIIDQQAGGAITHVGVATTWGLVVMSLIYALGDISGAHMNPAVSIAFTLAGRFEKKHLLPYILSQVCGALLASTVLKLLFPASASLGATLPSGSAIQSFVLELLLTFFLMLVVLNVACGDKERGLFAGIAVGSVVGLEAMFAGPICGASMNPARSLAPALVSGHLENLWVYLIATPLGATAAIPVWNYLTSNGKIDTI